MTRFARAKGSKSSNVRTAEDSTPWEVMKDQLLKSKQEGEETQKRKEAEDQRIENYNNFLKEHKTQKRKATWCEFPETEKTIKSKTDLEQSTTEVGKKDKREKKKRKVNSEEAGEEAPTAHKQNMKTDEGMKQNIDIDENKSVPQAENTNGKKNKKKKATALTEDNKSIPQAENTKGKKNKKEKATASTEYNKSVPQAKNTKGKKNKNAAALTEDLADKTYVNGSEVKTNNISVQNNIQKQQHKFKKQLNSQPKRKKAINDNSFELIINGKEIELVRFDGFPIMKKDAERLQELKSNMIKKGIPKSEVQRNMKLERRRAEKALARLKRDVCYNCRKGGHNLSDCPDLKSHIPGKEVAEGVCFKCGSTEHRQFECKVQRDKEFRFATCFICKEPGHIARQCPDNPRGLYPNGGCCKLCGDVTHLKKDCHSVQDKKEETTIKLPTLKNNDVEDIDFIPISSNTQSSAKEQKKPKKIKF